LRFIHDYLNHPFEWSKDRIPVLVIENKAFYREIITDILHWADNQLIKMDMLNKNGLKIKRVDILSNPLDLNFNNRSVHKFLETTVHRYLNEQYEMKLELINSIQLLLYQSLEHIGFQIEISDDIQVKNLLGVLSAQIVDDSESQIESLMNYLEVMSTSGVAECFIFLNLKHYFTDVELVNLYHFCLNREINIFLVEAEHRPLRKEKVFIVDDDLCEIY
jgi:CRISPR-associated protein, csn2 family